MKNKAVLVVILRNPIFILFSVCLGVYTGLSYPIFTKSIKIYGDVYIKLMMLTVFPLIITAIVSSVARLIHSNKLKKILPKMLMLFFLTFILCSTLAIFASIIVKPGSYFNDAQKSNLIELSTSSELSTFVKLDSIHILKKLENIVPQNIFLSLTSGNVLHVLLFSVLLGVSVGLINKKNSDYLIDIFDGLYSAVQNVVSWISILLPFGLFCIISNLISNIGFPIIGPMLRFILLFYILVLIIIILGFFVIWNKSGQKFSLVFRSLLDPIFVSFSTMDSIVAFPSSINAMVRVLKFEKETTSLFIPIGQVIGRYGNILFYALVAIFATQFYSIDLTISYFLLIILYSILAGISSSGLTGFATLPLIAIVLTPLKIPLEVILFIFVSIDLVIQPMRTLLTVFVNLIIASLFVQSRPKEVSEVSPGLILQNIPENLELHNYFEDFNEEIPMIKLNKSEFLTSVFPNAKLKKYKSWKSIEEKWNSYDFNIVIGDKDHLKELLNDDLGDSKLVVLNKRK